MMQECFLHLYQNIHKYNPELGSLNSWVFKVSTNVILKQIEKNKKYLAAHQHREHINLWDNTEIEIDPFMLFATLEELPHGYKEVLNLYVLQNKSHKEIAEELNISESTSRSQLSRAKSYFIKQFKNSNNEIK